MIGGWALCHPHMCAKRLFAKVDHRIFQMTWRWAKRRHSAKKKCKGWIKNFIVKFFFSFHAAKLFDFLTLTQFYELSPIDFL